MFFIYLIVYLILLFGGLGLLILLNMLAGYKLRKYILRKRFERKLRKQNKQL